MIKTLYVGDAHVKVSNLKESEDLMNFILETVKKEGVQKLVFLGDQFDHHAILRSEVLAFWYKWFQVFPKHVRTITLVGNHDLANFESDIHSMISLKSLEDVNFKIVDYPYIENNVLYVPYIHKNEEFIKTVNLFKDQAKALVCHADFDGAQYENGMYAPNGIKQEEVLFDQIIVGHVHSRSKFGKVIYPGTARWLKSSDANHEKGLWLVDHNEDGSIAFERFIDTSHVCEPILSFSWKEGEEAPVYPDKARVSIELIGSSVWIAKKKATLKGKVSVSSKITDRANKVSRKSGNSLEHFMSDVYATKTNRQKLINYAKTLNII